MMLLSNEISIKSAALTIQMLRSTLLKNILSKVQDFMPHTVISFGLEKSGPSINYCHLRSQHAFVPKENCMLCFHYGLGMVLPSWNRTRVARAASASFNHCFVTSRSRAVAQKARSKFNSTKLVGSN